MITLLLVVAGESVTVEYVSPGDILADRGLRAAFVAGHVTRCGIYRGGKRITGLPWCSWEQLEERVAEYVEVTP